MKKEIRGIVLAAGKGTRLKPYTKGKSKALLEIAPNVTIIEFIVDQLIKIGVDKITIAVRPEFLDQFKKKLGEKAKIVTVESEEEFGNLYTLGTALKEVKEGRIVVVMSDHIFERKILERFIGYSGDKSIVLGLDRRPDKEKEMEGLKVKLNVESVKEVGKKLKKYEGIDVGIFLLTDESYPIIKEVLEIKGSGANLSDLVNHAVKRIGVGYVDITGGLWMDIDTINDLKKARKLYWEIIEKNSLRD